MMTCRHVVDIEYDRDSQWLALHDLRTGRFVNLPEPIYSPTPTLDLALLPEVLPGKVEFFPILFPRLLHIGQSVNSLGYYAPGGQRRTATRGYFSGSIVNIEKDPSRGDRTILTLPYPIIEGLSGSPVLTYHNGPKLVGVAFGSQSQRIIAAEVLEVEEDQTRFRETVNRLVEFGLAYSPMVLMEFHSSIGMNHIHLSEQRHPELGLE